MKIKKILGGMTALAMVTGVATMPVTAVNEYRHTYELQRVSKEPTFDLQFVIFGYKEVDGNLIITSCFEYSADFHSFGGYTASSIFNGTLKIPSSIDGKAVIGIDGLSGNKNIERLIIPETVTEISDTAFRGCNLTVETTEREHSLVTVYCRVV